MRAFLFPHDLLTEKAAYIAALHQDNETARATLGAWLRDFDPETLPFAQHKLVSIAASRFPAAFDQADQAGVLANIHRQAKIRTHANMASLRRLLGQPGLAPIPVVALGELHEMLTLAKNMESTVDSLELGVFRRDLRSFQNALISEGFSVLRPCRDAPGRSAASVLLQENGAGAQLRILGLSNLPDSVPSKELRLMTPAAHARFMRSRLAGLLHRRDQVLFDLYHAHKVETLPGRLTARQLPMRFRGKAKAILGHN